jgi:nucleoside 2-deoxyribosyltransferase
MSGRTTNEAGDWHDEAEVSLRALGIDVLSPMRHNQFLAKTDTIQSNYEYHPVFTTDAGITTRDFNDVFRCDAVLMNLLNSTRISIGCMIEAGWAHALRKPIVLVVEDPSAGLTNVHEHPILRASAGYRTANLDDGVEAIHYLLGNV